MAQSQQRILDSHIHLWPQTATSPTDHGWMQAGHFLAKQHGISDYLSIATPPPTGFIYVETDRYLPSPAPPSDITPTSSSADIKQGLAQWAKQPLEEVRFLGRIAECQPADGDGFSTAGQAAKMKGCVIYAPFHLPTPVFQAYLEMAEEVAGPALWGRVVGFRYLLQGKGEGVVAGMLERDQASWVSNLGMLRRGRGGRGWCFDVGVDVQRDGYGPMEAVGRLIERVRERERREGVGEGKGVRFVLNHLAKHPLTPSPPTTPNPTWLTALSAFKPDPLIFMKFSGAFNEFTTPTPEDVPTLLTALEPLLDHVFHCFPNRVMFGSDWPVCNVGGPKGEAGNWTLWREVVEAYLEGKGMSAEVREGVWWRVAEVAYGVEV
ncbi:amidohydrolase family protein [Stemphylium lycopersici]|uniref:Amidohydrolase family protein n=1 Tax=Stemphylium lycopersici TaxID=183478 RepID=A0A364N5G9_STELY|nr:amidohydrolase family protein [Stemphylium lycopersici]